MVGLEQMLELKELAKQDVINKEIRIILVKASNYMTTKTEGRLFYWDVLSDPRKVRRTAGDYITGKIKKVEEDRILLYNCDFSDIKSENFMKEYKDSKDVHLLEFYITQDAMHSYTII